MWYKHHIFKFYFEYFVVVGNRERERDDLQHKYLASTEPVMLHGIRCNHSATKAHHNNPEFTKLIAEIWESSNINKQKSDDPTCSKQTSGLSQIYLEGTTKACSKNCYQNRPNLCYQSSCAHGFHVLLQINTDISRTVHSNCANCLNKIQFTVLIKITCNISQLIK